MSIHRLLFENQKNHRTMGLTIAISYSIKIIRSRTSEMADRKSMFPRELTKFTTACPVFFFIITANSVSMKFVDVFWIVHNILIYLVFVIVSLLMEIKMKKPQTSFDLNLELIASMHNLLLRHLLCIYSVIVWRFVLWKNKQYLTFFNCNTIVWNVDIPTNGSCSLDWKSD